MLQLRPNMCFPFKHHHYHYSHSEEYHTESSRGSDLSDIMEEDEEDLYSEMQLEEGRRRSINSHNTLKVPTAHAQGGAVNAGRRGGGQLLRRGSALAHTCHIQAHGGFAWLRPPLTSTSNTTPTR